MKPIRPDEVVAKKRMILPSQVIDAVNECIAKNWDGKESIVKQNELIDTIIGKFLSNVSRQDIFVKKYLDFEPVFEDEGWKVEYDKPAYCESYEPTFTFTKKRKKKS